MNWNIAEAFVEFGTTGAGSVFSTIDKIKASLREATKSGGQFDVAKFGGGMKGQFASLQESLSAIGPTFQRAFSMTSAGGAGLTTSITSAFSAAGPAIAAVLTNPFTLAITAGVAAAVPAINAAMGRERKLATMGAVMGSNAKAREIMGSNRQAFTGTDIDPEAADRAAQKLGASGTMSVDAIQTRVKQLAAISALTGDSMEGMAEALERAELRGQVTGRTLQAMPDVAEELTRMYPKMGGSALEAAEQGRIGMEHLEAAMARVAKRGQSVLDAQQGTTLGMFSQIGRSIGGMMADIGTPLLEVFKPVVAFLRDAFAGIGKTVTLIVNIATPAFKALGFAASLILSPFQAAFRFVTETFSQISAAMQPVLDVLGEIWDTFRGMLPAAMDFKDIVQTLLTPLRVVLFTFKSILEYIRNTVKMASALAHTLSFGLIGQSSDKTADKTAGAAAAPPLLSERGQSKSVNAFSFVGVTQLAEQMQQRVGMDLAMRQLDAAREGAEAQKKLANGMDGGVLKVRVVSTDGNAPLPFLR